MRLQVQKNRHLSIRIPPIYQRSIIKGSHCLKQCEPLSETLNGSIHIPARYHITATFTRSLTPSFPMTRATAFFAESG